MKTSEISENVCEKCETTVLTKALQLLLVYRNLYDWYTFAHNAFVSLYSLSGEKGGSGTHQSLKVQWLHSQIHIISFIYVCPS